MQVSCGIQGLAFLLDITSLWLEFEVQIIEPLTCALPPVYLHKVHTWLLIFTSTLFLFLASFSSVSLYFSWHHPYLCLCKPPWAAVPPTPLSDINFCICIRFCIHVLVPNLSVMSSSYNTLYCSLPGSSVHGILQARILEWVAISSSWDLPDPGIKPGSSALQTDS